MRNASLYCVVIVVAFACTAVADELSSVYCFAADARDRLATLDTSTTDGMVQRMILLHNLAFKGDVASRVEAEELNKRLRKKMGETPLLQAYRGSLEMIAVSHRSKAALLAGTAAGAVPFVDGPLDDLKEGFEKIGKAVRRDTANIQLRILRATAATEVGEHIPDALLLAYADLLYLGMHRARLDDGAMFFYTLSWAKYYYKVGVNTAKAYPGLDDWQSRLLAWIYVDQACGYATTQALFEEVDIWEQKVFSLGG